MLPNFFITRIKTRMPRHHMKGSPPTCSCSSLPFNYSPAGHVIAADKNIVNNDDLKSLIVKVQNLKKPVLSTGSLIPYII